MDRTTSPAALRGRNLILGVGGGIAAYKMAYLARRLLEVGANLRVVMTANALRFLGKQTMAAITEQPVVTTLFGDGQAGPSPHTELARWADAIVIAPATANVMAKTAHGLADDALTTVVAAFDGPVILAPAMHSEMWLQPSTQRNAQMLESDGRLLVGPTLGALAAGDSGMGRMVEPEEIMAAVAGVFDDSLSGLRVLVTAGGTREAIDPVRYVGNRSSGKMGHELAFAAARRGARVVLVTTTQPPTMPDVVEIVAVETAEQMAAEVWCRADSLDVAVLAAAVADFRPAQEAPTKLARQDGAPSLTLEPTPNILAGLVKRANPTTIIVGFAAETGGIDRAVKKAATYGTDLIVANDVTQPGSGFGTDTNQVTFIYPSGKQEPLPLMSKREVADQIWSLAARLQKE